MSIEFFDLKEERTREEIVEEIKRVFGPLKGRPLSYAAARIHEGHEPLMIIFDEAEQRIPNEVLDAMERMMKTWPQNFGLPKEYANPEKVSAVDVL